MKNYLSLVLLFGFALSTNAFGMARKSQDSAPQMQSAVANEAAAFNLVQGAKNAASNVHAPPLPQEASVPYSPPASPISPKYWEDLDHFVHRPSQAPSRPWQTPIWTTTPAQVQGSNQGSISAGQTCQSSPNGIVCSQSPAPCPRGFLTGSNGICHDPNGPPAKLTENPALASTQNGQIFPRNVQCESTAQSTNGISVGLVLAQGQTECPAGTRPVAPPASLGTRTDIGGGSNTCLASGGTWGPDDHCYNARSPASSGGGGAATQSVVSSAD